MVTAGAGLATSAVVGVVLRWRCRTASTSLSHWGGIGNVMFTVYSCVKVEGDFHFPGGQTITYISIYNGLTVEIIVNKAAVTTRYG